MEKVIKTVMKRIIDGRYDTNIFDQLIRLREEVRNSNCEFSIESISSIKEFCPFLKKDYTKSELNKIRKLLLENILEELKKEDLSYLQTARLVEAFDCLDDADKLPKSNKKVKFLVTFNVISQNYHMDIAPGLKHISLLDNV